ncbi:MAG: acyl-CoA dehydrogenase family protein [Thermodesulfobacteriota bacterium]
MQSRSWLTQEHRIFQESARRFLAQEVTPFIAQWEEQGLVPREVWRKLGQQGFLCPWVPEEYGGADVDYTYSIVFQEELIRTTCNSLSTGLRVHADIAAPYIARHGSQEQKRRILPGCVSGDIILALGMTEPDCGSDLAALRTSAVKDGADYVINGQKTFISNGIYCDWVVLAVKTDPKAPRHDGTSLILVPSEAPGFARGRRLAKLGLKAQDTAELIFSDCRVPQENLLGQEGQGFQIMMENLAQERLVISLGALVQAELILEMTLDYVKSRTAFGRPIGSFQANAFKLAEMATEVTLGRAFFESLIAAFVAGEDISRQVPMGKWWLAEMVNRVAYACLQLHGGYGYMEEYPICRLYRDVRSLPIVGGTSEIMKQIIAKQMGL